MTHPTQYLYRMLGFLIAVAVLAFLLSDALIVAFNANPLLNGLILAVLALGVHQCRLDRVAPPKAHGTRRRATRAPAALHSSRAPAQAALGPFLAIPVAAALCHVVRPCT